MGSKLGFFCYFLKFASLVFLDIAQDCSLGQYLTSSRAETTQIGTEMRFSNIFFSMKRGKILLILHISWLYSISFTYNRTVSFPVVEWLWIEFKTRPMLFKKYWNHFYSNPVGHPVKLACLERVLYWIVSI